MLLLSPILTALRSQTFEPSDLAIIGVLVVLEGLLSLDNALVLGLLARRLPPALRGRALTYGLAGALVFRVMAVIAASWLMRSHVVMLLGGLYLLYLSAKHFFWDKKRAGGPIVVARTGRPICLQGEGGAEDVVDAPHIANREGEGEIWGAGDGGVVAPLSRPLPLSPPPPLSASFWPTVLVIELTDIAVAVDSILAAIALVAQYAPSNGGTHPKLWVVIVGGMLGVILMRVAAVLFIKLLAKFPRFETSAYLLVALIGLKLIAIWKFNAPGGPQQLDFHSPSSAAFWLFWGAMAAAFCVGFVPKKNLATDGAQIHTDEESKRR